MTENWRKSLDYGGDLFFKAFYCLPRESLIPKLRPYGVIISWKYRTHTLLKKWHLCMWSDIINAIPQGSILGPLLSTTF